MGKEYKFIGESGHETPWRPLPATGVTNVMPRGREREMLGRTFGCAIRSDAPKTCDCYPWPDGCPYCGGQPGDPEQGQNP